MNVTQLIKIKLCDVFIQQRVPFEIFFSIIAGGHCLAVTSTAFLIGSRGTSFIYVGSNMFWHDWKPLIGALIIDNDVA